MASVAENHLAHILAEQRDAGEGVPRPADHSAVASLQHYVIQQLEAELAPGYVDFLAEANGLDFNGTVLYAAGSPGAEQSRDILEFRKLNDIFRRGGGRSLVIYSDPPKRINGIYDDGSYRRFSRYADIYNAEKQAAPQF